MKNELATWRAYYIVGSGALGRSGRPAGRSTTPTSCSRSGYAAAKTNDLAKARATLDVMKKVAATESEPSRRELAAIMERQLAAVISAAGGRTGRRVAPLRAAAELEDKTPRATGRPHPVKSSHELYGELLLAGERPGRGEDAVRTRPLAVHQPQLVGAGPGACRGGRR